MKNFVRLILSIFFVFFIFNSSNSQNSLYLVGILSGDNVGDSFFDVNDVGDINGDGYKDFIVGAANGKYQKLFYGGSPFDTIAYLKISCDYAAGIGDINGDGYSDLYIERRIQYPDSIYYIIKGIVYFGGSQFDTIPDFIMEDRQWSPAGGLRAYKMGDINNDSYDELLICTPYKSNFPFGRAYLYWGGSKIDSIPALTFTSDQIADFFGSYAASCDVNRDGWLDIIVGAPNDQTSRVVVFYNGTQIDTVADLILYGPNWFGFEIKNAGDINGDGYEEFLITNGGYGINLYFGADSMINFPGVQARHIGVKGDINNDGFNDIVIGAPTFIDSMGSMIGRVRGYYGNTPFDTLVDFIMYDLPPIFRINRKDSILINPK